MPVQHAPPLVDARGLGRTFGDRVTLRDVTFTVAPGEVVGLVGPNGGGKSTLLTLVAGLVRPTRGAITVCGVPADRLATDATGKVGLITAEPGLYPLLTGWENLVFFGALFGLPAAEVRARAAPLLTSLGLGDDALDARSGSYSSGMRQKVSLARALLLEPALLLLDEPTSALDPVSALQIFRTVRAQADRGVGAMIATHDLFAAEHVCDRVLFVAGTLRGVEVLDGPRGAPPVGRLHARYQELVS
jgi:ABC-type multidrug transport system ATPase subunit